MEYLTLQIAQLDLVVVGQHEMAHTRRCQVIGGGRTQAAGAHDQHPGGQQALLPFYAEFVQQNMPCIPEQLPIIHCESGTTPLGVIRYRSVLGSAGITGVFFSVAGDLPAPDLPLSASAGLPGLACAAGLSALATARPGSFFLTLRPSRKLMACCSW